MLVDGAPRVACVTPLRRVAGRSVTTVDGLPAERRQRLADAFTAVGASQCGFCTPGILVRLAGLEPGADAGVVESALLAHLCRCTGWRTVVDAGVAALGDGPVALGDRDPVAAAERAALEGGVSQVVGPGVALGRAPFAADTAPDGCLVAVPDGAGGWQMAASVGAARAAVAKVQGRRSGHHITHPVAVPPGDWALTWQTTWVEPAYLEPDASWCAPGADPVSPVANGGAFGAKTTSIAPAAARRLADEHGRPVLVVLAREDVVALGPKRPPVGAGVRADGSGVLRVVATPGVARAVNAVAPDLMVEEVAVTGPRTSSAIRGAGWVEAAVLAAAAASLAERQPGSGAGRATVASPAGAVAEATVGVDPAGAPVAVWVRVDCGAVLDEVVLRSYVVGAAHMALGWVCSEAIALDGDGVPQDLTIRSFGVLRAKDTPPVHVELAASDADAVNGSDAAFAAVAAATWIAQGLPPAWPTRRGSYR